MSDWSAAGPRDRSKRHILLPPDMEAERDDTEYDYDARWQRALDEGEGFESYLLGD